MGIWREKIKNFSFDMVVDPPKKTNCKIGKKKTLTGIFTYIPASDPCPPPPQCLRKPCCRSLNMWHLENEKL
jgi:hypothetical protein